MFKLSTCGQQCPTHDRFADQGWSVVGVEASELGIQQFYEEHGLEYTVEKHGDAQVYKVSLDCNPKHIISSALSTHLPNSLPGLKYVRLGIRQPGHFSRLLFSSNPSGDVTPVLE